MEGTPGTGLVGIGPVIDIGTEYPVDQVLLLVGGRSGLVIVADEVERAALSGIAAVDRAPVVEHIVDYLGLLVLRHAGVAAAAETGGTAGVMCDQVVVEGCGSAAPDAAVAVLALAVDGVGEALADDAPLHGEILIVIE